VGSEARTELTFNFVQSPVHRIEYVGADQTDDLIGNGLGCVVEPGEFPRAPLHCHVKIRDAAVEPDKQEWCATFTDNTGADGSDVDGQPPRRIRRGEVGAEVGRNETDDVNNTMLVLVVDGVQVRERLRQLRCEGLQRADECPVWFREHANDTWAIPILPHVHTGVGEDGELGEPESLLASVGLPISGVESGDLIDGVVERGAGVAGEITNDARELLLLFLDGAEGMHLDCISEAVVVESSPHLVRLRVSEAFYGLTERIEVRAGEAQQKDGDV